MTQIDSSTVAFDSTPLHGPVVIELDSSYESAEALRWAAGMSAALGTTLEATCTWHPGLGEFRPDAHDAVVRRLTAELGSWSELAKDAFVEPVCRVVEGNWPSGFVHDAEARGASLLVLPVAVSPSPSASNSEATARTLLQTAPRAPVALVPTSGAGRTVRRIVVGTPDGVSPRRLIETALILADVCGAELHVVSVLPLAPEWVPSSDPNSMWQVERRTREMRWSPHLESHHITHQFHVVEGSDTVEAWLRFARHMHADVIVASTEWRGSVSSARRATSLVRLARDSGIVVVSIPSGPGRGDG